MRNDDDNLHRQLTGCIVTVENVRTKQMITWHVEGRRHDAIHNIADRLDALGPSWKVASYSTPSTIRADLDGAYLSGTERHPEAVAAPETMLLSRISRADLVHPRLIGGVKKEGRHRGRVA